MTLIEARDRIGGRVHTIRPACSSRPIELGAEFIHGDSNALWPVVGEAGLPTEAVAERHEGRRDGREVRFPDARGVLDHVLGPDPAGRHDRPLIEVLKERRTAGDDPALLSAAAAYVESFHAADVRRIGTRALAETEAAEGEDGEEAFRLPDGYDGVPRWLHARCAHELLDLRLSTTVLSLRWRPGEVVAAIRGPDGTAGEVDAQRAVITLPLGVLRAPPGEPGAVPIDPEPPGWREALPSLEMGAAHRIVLRFEEAWWQRPGEPAVGFVQGPGSAFPVWWASPPGDGPHLTGWCGGPRAASLAGRPPDAILRAALDSLAVTFGRAGCGGADRMRGAHHHDWVTDPLSLGAYSYGGVGAEAARKFLVHPVAGALYLAGEAMGPDGRSATVHGALMSGARAAERILED